VDPYTCAKVRHDQLRGFVSAHALLCAPKTVSFFVFVFCFLFFRVLATRYSQGPWIDFDTKYTTKTRGSAQGCAFSGSRT